MRRDIIEIDANPIQTFTPDNSGVFLLRGAERVQAAAPIETGSGVHTGGSTGIAHLSGGLRQVSQSDLDQGKEGSWAAGADEVEVDALGRAADR